ncbi:MAG: SDR family NAD(P)-dependent oxidoreductase [Thermoleophilia bacterium]|nr:SDR family NAD(P)-dependent oxidoreductase [Thermoleophilia bacterium]
MTAMRGLDEVMDPLIVITGGSRGLGAALCGLYHKQGWRVVEFSRTAPHPFSVRLDLSDSREVAEVFERTFTTLARVEVAEVVVINNAAVLGPVGPVGRSSVAQIVGHLETNVTSAVLLARAFVAAFQEHSVPKTFVNISSGVTASPLAGWSLYSASKSALESFTRAMALEQAGRSHPIRAFSVNPGVMDTAMQEVVRSSSAEEFPDLERFVRYQQEGNLVRPALVALRIAEIVAARPEAGGVYSARP